MCAICGVVSRFDEAELRRMTDAVVHRGPDDEGCFFTSDVALGVRRLSIIDVPGGRQPITNEDGTLVVVFNGEIYNYPELRSRLEARGHHFSTRSDTEVLAPLRRGTRCLRRGVAR